MTRFLAIIVFSAAVAGATLAGSGMVVAPHVDPPGTPLIHDHVLAAYRFPIFLMRLQERYFKGQRFSLETPLSGGTVALVMATLLMLIPRLPRPTQRQVASVAQPITRRPQWNPFTPLAPPRSSALRFVFA